MYKVVSAFTDGKCLRYTQSVTEAKYIEYYMHKSDSFRSQHDVSF